MTDREIIKVSEDEAYDIAFEINDNFKRISKEITGNGRWHVSYEVIVQRIEDGKFFKSHYSEGSTEYQCHSPYEYDDPIFTQVFPVEKTIIVYE